MTQKELPTYMSKDLNNARPLPVYFVTTEGVGSHYEGQKYGTVVSHSSENIAHACLPTSIQ